MVATTPLDEDLLAILGMFFDAELTFHQCEELLKAEMKLWHDIHLCLEDLLTWIGLSHPHVSLEAMLERHMDAVGEDYPCEIQCWAEENQTRINDLVERAITFLV